MCIFPDANAFGVSNILRYIRETTDWWNVELLLHGPRRSLEEITEVLSYISTRRSACVQIGPRF